MGRYAQARRRGSAVASASALLPAPSLEAVGGGGLIWIYTDTEPTFWLIQSTSDGGATWVNVDATDGTQRIYFSVDPGTYRIVGTSGDFSEFLTEPSNTVVS